MWRELHSSDLLERVLDGVPLHSDVVDWLFIEVLQHLGAESVGDFVVEVKLAALRGKDIDRVGFLDFSLLPLLLRFAEWKDAVLRNVVAMAVG